MAPRAHRSFAPRAVGTLLVWLCALGPARAAADSGPIDIGRVGDAVGALGLQIKALTDAKVVAEANTGLRPFDARFADAEVYFSMGDYPNAALMLYGLAVPANLQEPGYAKAVAYLAESFFHMGNDLLAARYFQDVFDRKDVAAMPDAARRLIQIAERRQSAEHLDEALAVLQANIHGSLPPDIAYAYAKNLVHRHRGAPAYEMAGQVPDSHTDWLKARYLRGVALLDMRDIEGALHLFEALETDPATTNPAYAAAGELKMLASLNRARLLFEVGKAVASEAVYQAVPRDSEVYNDALFEETWVALDAAANAPDEDLRNAAYTRAQHSLELLLLTGDNSPLAPEAHLLSANILVKLGRYDAAEKAFAEVVAAYRPVWDQVEALTRANKDVTRIFLHDPNAVDDPAAPPPLPPLAAHFAEQEKSLERTVELSRQLDENETWLAECDGMIERLTHALDVQERAQVSTALQDVQGRHLELQNHLLQLTEDLQQVERGLVRPALDAEHSNQLNQVLAERAQMEPDYRKLPQTRSDYADRTRATRDQLSELQKQEFDLKWVIVGAKQQIAALRTWMAEHPETLTPQSAAQLTEELRVQESGLLDLERTRSTLNTDIDEQRTLLAVGNPSMSDEDALRARYAENLERERLLLSAASGSLSGDARVAMDKVKNLRATLEAYRGALDTFRSEVAKASQSGTRSTRVGLDSEGDALAQHRKEMQGVRVAAGAVVPELAAESLGRVRDKLRDIVVRGDVGIVDISWAIKDEQTEMLNRKVSEAHDEQQMLDVEAKELLKD